LPEKTGSTPRRAIVFSGGGARGAYEAGVVRYLVEELPRRMGHPLQCDIICGTSVGAIHACFMGATAHHGPGRGERLVDFWQSMRIEEVLPFGPKDVLGLARRVLGRRQVAHAIREGEAPERIYGMLDTKPLEQMVVRAIPWRSIRKNVREGRVHAVCVPATEIATGRVVVFLETQSMHLDSWTRDPSVVPSLTRLRPHHALASAAIPILFPAVRIDDTYYADGGLRLNTPLSPVLRLGADRVLVIALRQSSRGAETRKAEEHSVEDYASPAYLFGKVLNAIMLDHLDTDLSRMHVMNEMIGDGEKAFGSDFLSRLNEIAQDERGQRFHHIEDLVIRPSADLGRLASEVLETLPAASQRSPFFRFAMRGLNGGDASTEADLLSYLLFDGEFVAPLAELGYRDAEAREEELVRFFTD
jgi:NTE family protein